MRDERERTASRAEGFRARVAYIVYWGILEPLGQSLVLPSVTQLARRGVELTLVTFEKPADADRREDVERVRAALDAEGVRWIPLRYHKRPKWPATAFDILHGSLRTLLCSLRSPIDVVHARTFVGGPMGLAAARLLRARFIYHNEGFYPDEQVDGGVWRRGSPAHRIAGRLERALYERADGLITLSHRARAQVCQYRRVAQRRTPVIVVPSTVDIERFRPRKESLPGPLRLVYIGSVGARYILDEVGRFVAVAARLVPDLRLRVLTPAEAQLVERMLAAGGLARHVWESAYVPHSAMPGELVRAHAGLFFLARGLSEHGCSPTKIGEYWACGLPVVTTPNVSDTDSIVEAERVGIVIPENSDEAYASAAGRLVELLKDPGLSERCRKAAERHYALEPACDRQVELYREVLVPAKAA